MMILAHQGGLGGSAARERKPNTVDPLAFLEYGPVPGEVLGCGSKLGQLTKIQ